MSGTFKFELVSPEKLLMSEDVTQVLVPGAEGEFCVLPKHAPVLSTLKPGVLEIEGGESGASRVFVRSGFAEVGPDSLTILAQRAIDLKDVDRDELDQQIKDLDEDVADAKDELTKSQAEDALKRLSDIRASL